MAKKSAKFGTARFGMSHFGTHYDPKTDPAFFDEARFGYARFGVYISNWERLKKKLEQHIPK